jgi:tetratricopeptide (TPR) repeat protein
MSTDTSKSLFDQAMKEILSGNFVTAEHLLQQASEINEESTTLYAASWAVLLALRDREEEAISILEERLASHSTDGNLLLAYGITLEKQQNWDDAEDAFREVLSNDPDNPGALRGLSAVVKQKGDNVEAATLAVRAFSEAPDNAIFAKTAADLLEAIDQPKTAFEILDLAAHYNPEDEEMVSRALKGCLANNMIDRAREILSIVDINMPWAAGWKASFLDWQGEPAKADELIQRTLSRPAGMDKEFLFQAACIMMRRGNFDAAEDYVGRILEQDPQHTGALRIRADLSLGRVDLDGAIDPLMKAFALSSDTLTGWRLFWSCVVSRRFDAAEETLTTLAEDEDLMSDILEATRLELAAAFLDAAQDHPVEQKSFPNLDMLPDEASCGLLLEFLEAIEDYKHSTSPLEELYAVLFRELGARDPMLRLNRLYARGTWKLMEQALDELYASIEDGEPALGFEQTGNVHRLYSLLTGLAMQDQDRIEKLSQKLEGEMQQVVVNILVQKGQRNPTEQRWLDRLTGGTRRAADLTNPSPVAPAAADKPLQTTPTGVPIDVRPASGGVIDGINKEEIEIVYETEDGELISDLASGNYEVVDEDEEEDNEQYEYIWVEEEIDDSPPENPKESYTP